MPSQITREDLRHTEMGILAMKRYAEGRRERCLKAGDPWIGDPLVDAAEEAIDGFNYCTVLMGQDGLSESAKGHIEVAREKFRTAYDHLRMAVSRMEG